MENGVMNDAWMSWTDPNKRVYLSLLFHDALSLVVGTDDTAGWKD